MSELYAIDPALLTLHERLESLTFELDDVAQEIRRYGDSVESDPQRLSAVDDRLDLIARLKRKYGATVEEVIEFGARVRLEMEEVENLDERIGDAERLVREAEALAGRLAEELSEARGAAAAEFTGAMRQALQGLGLKSAGFEAELGQESSEGGVLLPDARPPRFLQSQRRGHCRVPRVVQSGRAPEAAGQGGIRRRDFSLPARTQERSGRCGSHSYPDLR